jgi:hypothetical protein
MWGLWVTVAGWVLATVVAHYPQRARARGLAWADAGMWGAIAVGTGWVAVGVWAMRRRRTR